MYDELRRLAAKHLKLQRGSDTLHPADLVHQAYFHLLSQGRDIWQSRALVLGFGAGIMRQILVGRSLAGTRLKGRGPDCVRIAVDFPERGQLSVLTLEQALRVLEESDPRQGQIVEMRFFGDLTTEDIANALSISPATVKREWTLASARLRRELSQPSGHPTPDRKLRLSRRRSRTA